MYDDYDDRKNTVDSYAEDYTEDKVLIDFFQELADAETYGIREFAEFGKEDDMEKSESFINEILAYYEEYSSTINFHEVLNVKENTGGEIPAEDLLYEVTHFIDRKNTLDILINLNKNIEKYLNKSNEYLFGNLLIYKKEFNLYKEEIANIKKEEELTSFLFNFKIKKSLEYFDKHLTLENKEKKYTHSLITEKIHNDYNSFIKKGDRFVFKNNDIYLANFITTMRTYKTNKTIIDNSEFKFNDYLNINDLQKNLYQKIFIENNLNHMNTELKFKRTDINHLQKHLEKIVIKESQDYLSEKFSNDPYILNNFFNNIDKNKISNKVIETFNTYKKYEHLFKNHKKLPKNNPLHFDIFDHESIEVIDDFFQLAISKNQTKLYAKRFLGSYMKLMNEDSLDFFHTIKEKDINKSLIRNELRKIALFKDSETLNRVLDNIITLNNQSITKTIYKINDNKLNVDIALKEDNLLILSPNDYEASNSLGSGSWCISTSNYYFNNYLNKGDKDRYHFFVFDFNFEETHPLHKIGITVEEDYNIANAFDKKNKNIISNIHNLITENSFEKIKENIDFLKSNKNNYNIFNKIKDEPNITVNRINEEYKNPVDFYIYLIKSNKLPKLITSIIDSEEEILKIINYTLDNKEKKSENLQVLLDIIKKENKSITINLTEIINKKKENTDNIENILKTKQQNNKTISERKIKRSI